MYFGHSNRTPQIAKDVAKAFYEGRPLDRRYVKTDGRTYTLMGTVIAMRIPEDELPQAIAKNIVSGTKLRQLSFTFAGYPTPLTARHLTALGFKAYVVGRKKPIAVVDGHVVEHKRWYSMREVLEEPLLEDVLTKPKPRPVVDDRQLQLL